MTPHIASSICDTHLHVIKNYLNNIQNILGNIKNIRWVI